MSQFITLPSLLATFPNLLVLAWPRLRWVGISIVPLDQAAALLYAVVVAFVMLFQFCLIFGAPWGRITQGGSHEGPLPVSGRAVAALSVFILMFMGASVTSAAGLAPNWSGWTAHVAIGIQGVSTLLNWITPSRPERLVWAPITSIMLLLAAYAVFIR